jgi:hypothetical protein
MLRDLSQHCRLALAPSFCALVSRHCFWLFRSTSAREGERANAGVRVQHEQSK